MTIALAGLLPEHRAWAAKVLKNLFERLGVLAAPLKELGKGAFKQMQQQAEAMRQLEEQCAAAKAELSQLRAVDTLSEEQRARASELEYHAAFLERLSDRRLATFITTMDRELEVRTEQIGDAVQSWGTLLDRHIQATTLLRLLPAAARSNEQLASLIRAEMRSMGREWIREMGGELQYFVDREYADAMNNAVL